MQARAPRLSDWLRQNKLPENAYPLGLLLRVPEELPSQSAARLQLIAELAGGERALNAGQREGLRALLQGLPATGRMRVVSTEARWLEANPRDNPVLGPGYTVSIPPRPSTVTVIRANGELCRVVHRAGYEAKSYVEACRQSDEAGADWAWVAQPDGNVQRVSVASWNASKQDEPAPGAWIWSPARNSGWPDTFSDRLIHFLATQGPAPDQPQAISPPPEPGIESGPKTPGGEASGLNLSTDVGLSSRGSDVPRTGRPEPLSLKPDMPPSPARDLHVSSSDWGNVGLLQTPTARMRQAGAVSFTLARTDPYTHGNLFAQPFDWLEAGFRYTDINNRLYSSTGTQSYKDKGIDIKFRAWKESAYIPEVAIGFRDVAGTGLFSGEYVVANKRTGDFDWSLGMGWGYLAGTGSFRNPLSVLSSSFDTREVNADQGGRFNFKTYFRGRASLFGGVQYQTPWDSLILKAEYDGNDYQNEPQLNNQKQDSRLNFGLVYRAAKWADVTLAYERGNTVTLGVSLHGQLNRLSQAKIADPAPVPVVPVWPAHKVDWAATNRDIERQTDWQISSIERRDNDLRIVVDDPDATYWRSRIDRAAAVLHRDAPSEIDRFTLTLRSRGVDVSEHVVDRQAWVSERTQALPPSARHATVVAQPPAQSDAGGTVLSTDTRPALRYSFGLNFLETFGGPDAFLLYQLSAAARAQYRIRDDTWLQGLVRYNLVNNYDKFKTSGDSSLPRVRTFLREYLTTADLTIANLQLTHVGKFNANHFYSVYGGYLEEMFGGVGGEWLYRPFASRLSFGVDVNAVRQRDFDQHFGFRDYDTVTGHATMYWETGWNDVLVRVHAGRYLAGDVGATLDVSRVFRNGVVLGAFATKTNVSAAEFGEGSFDKGVYIRIPFDSILPRSTSLYANFLWRPLTRDGGAMLARSVQLYGLTRTRSDRTLEWEAPPLPNEMRPPPRHVEESIPPRKPEPPAAVRPSAPVPVAQWEKADSIEQHRLAEALYSQQFRNVAVTYDGSQRVVIDASHAEMRPISRAVGRVARTALRQAPVEAREIVITFYDGIAPQARYEFFDLPRLRRYFEGEISTAQLKDYVKVEWLNPAARESDPLARLADLNPETSPQLLASVVPETFSVTRVANDVAGAADTATKVNWLRAGAIGAGLVLSSSILDNTAYRRARDHAGNRSLDNFVKFGDALPLVGFVAAGALALDGSDPRRSRTGYAAVEAGATAFAFATGLKYVVGRARPTTGAGNREFNWLTSDDAYGSFPSRHTAVAWALATPFALEYDMPWLYGVAALTNLARIGSREHWVSDTVASSLLGYGIGRLFWQSAREQAKGDPKVYFDGSSLGLSWGW